MNNDRIKQRIIKTKLYQALCSENANLEIWEDNYIENGKHYISIINNFGDGIVKKIAYLRISEEIIEMRKYDLNGNNIWNIIN